MALQDDSRTNTGNKAWSMRDQMLCNRKLESKRALWIYFPHSLGSCIIDVWDNLPATRRPSTGCAVPLKDNLVMAVPGARNQGVFQV